MQLELGFWFPFGCWSVFQVSTQAHRQGMPIANDESVNRGAGGVALTSSTAFILGRIRGGSFAQRHWLELLAIECDGDGDFFYASPLFNLFPQNEDHTCLEQSMREPSVFEIHTATTDPFSFTHHRVVLYLENIGVYQHHTLCPK